MRNRTDETAEAVRAAAILFADWVAAGDFARAEEYASLAFSLADSEPEIRYA